MIQEILSDIDIERNNEDRGYAGTKLIVKSDSRHKLPYMLPEGHNVPIWKILGKFASQDITKISLPVILCEPLNILQRSCEMMAHNDLLRQGAASNDSQYRLICCSLFGILQHSFQIDRFKKPFNPILGETFEFATEDYRYIAEQVSHHPPISAYEFEGQGYRGEGVNHVIQSFKLGGGKGQMSFEQPGVWQFFFDQYNEAIEISKPRIMVNNVVFGGMYFDIEDKSLGKNLKTGDSIEINFTPKSWTKPSKLEGTCKDRSGKVIYEISGSWLDQVSIKNV